MIAILSAVKLFRVAAVELLLFQAGSLPLHPAIYPRPRHLEAQDGTDA
jgi:hypothetical protein